MGFAALEIDFPGCPRNHREFLRLRLEEHGWLGLGGSDHHGDDPHRYLGCRTTPEPVWHALLAKAEPRPCGSSQGPAG
jgi:hypothetical protein